MLLVLDSIYVLFYDDEILKLNLSVIYKSKQLPEISLGVDIWLMDVSRDGLAFAANLVTKTCQFK